jgi:hypothetical protein
MEDLKDKGKGGRKAIPLFQSLVYIFVFFTPLYHNERVFFILLYLELWTK